MNSYRVWPDGTVQDTEAEAYSWMSDDYVIVEASSEEEAILICKEGGWI